VAAYAAQIAAQLGAHIIKVKLPSAHIELPAAKKVYDQYAIPRDTLAQRVAHVVQSAFDGHRIVIFSGGAKKDDDAAIFEEVRAIRDGGGFGSIIGRNTFQRSKADAMKLLDSLIAIYLGQA
jgi:fructose-bisphosphate aldolase, class I